MDIKVKQQLLGLAPYKPGKPIEALKRELGIEKITKLASNENPFGCSAKVKEVLARSSQDVAIYPDGYAMDLRQKLAQFLHIDSDQLMFGAGSDEIVLMLSRALLTKGTNTIMAKPTFPQYRHHAIIEGADVREVDTIDGRHDLEGMLKQIDDNTKIIWVCTPDNPTGHYIPHDELFEFVTRVPSDILIVIDEAYYEYVTKSDYPDTISWLNQFSNLLILRTFSKAYGLAGLRIGYAIGHRDLMTSLDPVRPPFNVSRLAQQMAIAAIDDQSFIERVSRENANGLAQYVQFCTDHHLKYYPSQGNFILIDFQVPGDVVFNYLLKKGFIVRSGEALGYPTTCRITVGDHQQNEAIIAELTTWLNSKTS